MKNGLLRTYPPLKNGIGTGALIVGGGITGALMAHRLVSAGVDCVVLDRRDIGHGSTSASTGLLQYEIDTPLHELEQTRGRDHARRAYQLGVEAIEELSDLAAGTCGFARRPSLLLARSPRAVPKLRREFDSRCAAGLAVEWVTRNELTRHYGIPREAAIRSAVAAECDPYRLTHQLLDFCVSRGGCRVFDRTGVLGYELSRTGIRAATARGVSVRARAVFFATGYETKPILPGGLVKLSSTYALVTEPVPDLDWWRGRSLLWETGKAYLYSRTTSDRRILVGGEDDDTLDPARRDARVPRKAKRLMERFRTVFPRARIEPAFEWAGTFGATRDGLAYIGKYEPFPRGYFALGFGGNGITFSTTAARILTNLFLGKKDPDAEIYRFAR